MILREGLGCIRQQEEYVSYDIAGVECVSASDSVNTLYLLVEETDIV